MVLDLKTFLVEVELDGAVIVSFVARHSLVVCLSALIHLNLPP